MGSRDSRIDAYIVKSADFAKPILQSLRKTVHEACPQVEETIKWGSPSFIHAGGILCGMAAFKQHASFGFWKHALVMGADAPRDGMGSYGKITSLSELPPKRQLIADLKKAMTLNEQGIMGPGVRRRMAPRPPPEAPADLVAALNKSSRARAVFEAFPPSRKREYIDWIVEAKREQTRARRLAQAINWIAEGKSRNWKYSDG